MNHNLYNGKRSRQRISVALFLLPFLLYITTSCSRNKPIQDAIYTCHAYTVFPDSFVSTEIKLHSKGDSAVVTNHSGIECPISISNKGTYIEGSDTLLNILFNRPTPGSFLGEYDAIRPYELYLTDALLSPSESSNLIDSRIENGGVANFTIERQSWPVISADAAWTLAADVVNSMETTSDKGIRRANVAWQMLQRDIDWCYDSQQQLFTGTSAALPSHMFPTWIDEDDKAACFTALSNIDRIAGLHFVNNYLPKKVDENFIDSLRKSIAINFWQPDKKQLSFTIYGQPCPIAIPAADNLTQAIAILTDAIPTQMACSIVAKTPLMPDYIPQSYPQFGNYEQRRQSLITALWTVAAAKVNNHDAYAHALSSLINISVNDDNANRLLKGVILRTVFGITPHASGLQLTPYIHPLLGKIHKLNSFKYKDASISITIEGTGNIISSFAIDGEVRESPVIPSTISSGNHDVYIILGNTPIQPSSSINIVSTIPDAPQSPTIEYNSTAAHQFANISSPTISQYAVYYNGSQSQIISSDKYNIPSANATAMICFAPISETGVTGFASQPILYISPQDSSSIYATKIARRGGRILANKDLAASHVESTRYKNSTLSFTINSHQETSAYLRLRYLDGLGIVNPERTYALRTISINDSKPQLMLLPQRKPNRWRYNQPWTEMTGTTLPVKCDLIVGDNTVDITYFVPDDIAADYSHDNNVIIPIALEIIHLKE